jgi:hypothetical protein
MEWDTLKRAREGDVLTLKGFLYRLPSGEWILSSEPGLKSCCLGHPSKLRSQVFLTGDFSPYTSNTLLNVQGTMHTTSEGKHQLAESKVMPKCFPFWSVGALLVCFVLIGFKLKRLLLP